MILYWLRSSRIMQAVWVGLVFITWSFMIVLAAIIWVTVDPSMFENFSWCREWEAIKVGKLAQ